MRLSMLGLIVALMTMLSLFCCVRQPSLSPSRWLPAGGEFDSLTNRLEWQFNDFAPFDSIRHTIELMERLVAMNSADYDLKMSRILYWKARFLGRTSKYDSAETLIRQALELNDSIRYRYDNIRILMLLYAQNDSIDGATLYSFFTEAFDYAHDIGDKSLEATMAINLGNLFGGVGEYDKGLYYLNIADSLNEAIGYEKLKVKNKINESRLLNGRGDRKMSDSILRSLIGHPYLEGDTFVVNLIYRNLYASTYDSVDYLYKAYDLIQDNYRFRSLRGLYRGLLLNHNLRMEEFDSVRYYAELVREDLPYVFDYGHKSLMWYNLSLAWEVSGKLDSALYARVRYEAYVDSMHRQQRTADVLRLSALSEMERREARYAASLSRRNMIMALVAVAFVASGIAIGWVFNRRRLKLKMKAMENELELEKARRKMAATAISMEEKDKVLGVLKTGLSELREEGEMNEGNVRQMESAIKNHMLEHDTDESFQQMFDVVNPGFKQRLKERCPNLADSYVKLACYILMELDNKKIARLMMIKPESVHQARWRLRQRLGLKEGETLESALNALNEKR